MVIERYKFGKLPAVIAGAGSTNPSNAFILVEGPPLPGIDNRVRSNFEYVVTVLSSNDLSIVGPIQVVYR